MEHAVLLLLDSGRFVTSEGQTEGTVLPGQRRLSFFGEPPVSPEVKEDESAR